MTTLESKKPKKKDNEISIQGLPANDSPQNQPIIDDSNKQPTDEKAAGTENPNVPQGEDQHSPSASPTKSRDPSARPSPNRNSEDEDDKPRKLVNPANVIPNDDPRFLAIDTEVFKEIPEDMPEGKKEKLIKKWRREIKYEAIAKENPFWHDLYSTLT